MVLVNLITGKGLIKNNTTKQLLTSVATTTTKTTTTSNSKALTNTLVFLLLFSLISLVSGQHKQQQQQPQVKPPNKSSLYSFKQAHTLDKRAANFKLQDELLYNPVLFIPGDGGSQLEARLNKTRKVHYFCTSQSDWFDVWLNVHLLVPGVIDCLLDNMMLYYNKTTRTTQNSEGVEIRATKFGSVESVAYLDIWNVPYTGYFENIIDTISKENGHTRDANMHGASYDFRKAPNELSQYFYDVGALIEDMYVHNNYRPVTLICHSMGCLNSLYLLNQKTQNWRDVFVKRLITLAAPWDGAFKAISAMLFGDNLGIPFISKEKLQSLQSTFPSLMYLFPRSPTFARDRVLVETETKNYTLENLDELFNVTGLLDQMEMWHDTRAIAANLTAPNVELWCLYGTGSKTPSKIKFKGSIEKGDYEEEQSDGDGTVNLESLRACERFQAQQNKPVYTRLFDNTDHVDILRGADVAQYISRVILPGDLPGPLHNNNEI